MNYYRRDSARILKHEDNNMCVSIAFAYCRAQSDTTVLSRDDAVLFKEGAECITGCRKVSAKGRREK